MNASTLCRKAVGLAVGLAVAYVSQGSELPMSKPESAGLSSVKLEKVDAIVRDLVANRRLAGATVAISRQGKIAYFKTFGQRDIEAKAPMTEDTIFRIYSMSKAITTAAALTLVDDGKIQLDDPVSKYIPEFKDPQVAATGGKRPAKREPTVRDLMRHTAGLTYGASETPVDSAYRNAKILDRDTDLRTMCAALGNIPLQYDPGTAWQYSVAIDVLGRVIEVASGRAFDEFLEERIFQPLEMKDTGFFVPEAKAKRLAACYFADGKGGLKVQDSPGTSPYLQKPRFLSGGGGLVSTTRDYLRFLTMVENGGKLQGRRILKAKTVEQMINNEVPTEAMPIRFGTELRYGLGFGLGFNVRVEHSDKWDPASPVGEYGWGGMASTHYWASPKDQLIVVTMEQTLPYSFMLETAVKGPIYDALLK